MVPVSHGSSPSSRGMGRKGIEQRCAGVLFVGTEAGNEMRGVSERALAYSVWNNGQDQIVLILPVTAS